MAPNSQRQRLKGLIDGSPSPAGDDLAPSAPSSPAELPAVRRGAGYHLGVVADPDADLDLSGECANLPGALLELARQYVGARRRSGEELLKAARWLSEARAMAKAGEWQLFLEATNTSHDTASRLINIHRLAMENPQFAESVARNWIGHSAAALLAQPSTPPAAIEDVLAGDEPPSVATVRETIRAYRSGDSGGGGTGSGGAPPQFADSSLAGEVDLIQTSFFDRKERDLIPILTSKIELVLRGNASLQPEEWHLIAPLAEALYALLRQHEER